MSGKTRPAGRQLLRRAAALLVAVGLIAGIQPTVVAPVRAADTADKAPGGTAAPNTWTNATNALTANGQVATASTNSSQGFDTFGFSIPAGSIITGITVKALASDTDNTGCSLSAATSWNGGSSWSSSTSTPINNTAATVTIAGGTFGHVWDPTETTNGSFRLRLTPTGNNCSGTASVDWVTVSLTYDTIKSGTANAALGSDVCEAADFNFVVDMSGSIGAQGNAPSNLPDLKAGITGFVSSFEAAGGSGRYSGTRFNDGGTAALTSGYASAATFTSAVNALNNPSLYTPTAAGINAGAGNNANDRAGVPNIMFVVTDGSPNQVNSSTPDTNNPQTWLNAANAAVTAADNARAGSGASKYIVKAVYLSTANDPGDTTLPFSAAGDAQWATKVMDEIGGGSHLSGDFSGFVNDLFAAIGCKPPALEISKTADDTTVNAGASIGFTITAHNKGGKAAHDVVVTDALPGSLTWTIDPAKGGCSIASGTLTCNFGGLAAGASESVHVVADTGKACGVYDNTAQLTSSDAGGGSASASVNVLCPDVKVTKTPNDGSVSRGETATFSIKVENAGEGTAKDVVVTDTLPVGFAWTESEGDCSIANGILSCNAGNLGAGESKTYTVSAPTAGVACDLIPNTASATASNEVAGNNNSDDAAITVKCADIAIAKKADAESVSAGSQIGFTVTVKNTGAGTAFDVSAEDMLDGRFTWSLDPASAGWSLNGSTLAYGADALGAGDSSSVHVVAATNAELCGPVDNTATVETGEGGTDSASASTEILCPDIHVTKTAVADRVDAGDDAGFTITITNTGKGVAKNVILTDTLPAGAAWAISPANGDCEIAGSTLTCTFGSIPAGGSASVTVSGPTANDVCGPIENTASASAENEARETLADNAATASLTVDCPDVTVAKTADAPTVDAGSTAGFTITVSNSGKGTAHDVTVEDLLPGGVTWLVTPSNDACAIDAGTLTCTFDELAPNASASVHIAGVTDAKACATLENTATVSAANEPTKAGGNNADTAEIAIQCPNVTIEKAAIEPSISAGELAGFTITVKNEGPGTATDVQVEDALVSGIAWVEDSEDCSIDAGVLTCDFGDLTEGATASVNVTGETDAEDCTTLYNTATVSASNEPESAVSDNQATASLIVSCPAVSITKTAVDPIVDAGDEVAFDIVVSNNGVGTAFDIKISDTLPGNAGTSWSIASSTPADGWSIVGDTLTYTGASLASGASVSARIHTGTTAATCGTVDNTATLSYRGGKGGDDAQVEVLCPDISLVKTGSDESVSAGDPISFTLTVTNNGAGAAHDAGLVDDLPAGIAWAITPANPYCSITDGVLSCAFGSLEAGASKSVTVTGTTTPAVCGTVDNEATASASNEAAAATGDNTDGATIGVDCADVTVTKTAVKETVLAGQTAAFQLVVTSIGPGTAKNVVLTDALPGGLAWQVDDETCSISGAGVLTCPIGSMAAGSTFEVTVAATTPETIESCGTLSLDNTASVSASNERQDALEDNSDSASVDVVCAQLELVKTAGDAADGETLTVAAPGSVVFTYVVTNTGSADLAALNLVDDNATPADTTDDVSVTCPKTNLAAGESMTCQATLAVGYGSRTNIATVTGYPVLDRESTVTATDDAVVLVPEPEVTPTPTPKPTPRVTPPPTSTIDGESGGSAGSGLLLVLVAIAGLMLAAGYLVPARATARKRNRRG